MFGKSPLTKGIEKWIAKGGDLDKCLSSSGDRPIKSKAEANSICAALDALRTNPGRAGKKKFGSPLHTLTAFFQQVETEEAFDILKQEGLPRLRSFVRDWLAGKQVDEDALMFVLKILAMYRQREDVMLIAEATRKSIHEVGYMWSIVLGQFDTEHPFSALMVEALRNPLPSGFLLVAYLDLVNGLAAAGQLDQHPFNSEAGSKLLEAYLRDDQEEYFSYARSATTALPFIAPPARKALMEIADQHPDASVRMEAAWARAKSGDATGLERLAELCLDPRYSSVAQRYLEELGCPDQIPAKAQQPDFQALAEMANWLAYPSEFGRPPSEIELYDTREIYWPPTDDQRRVWLLKYTYDDIEESEPDRGVGMVGSVTFALFGEATAELSPEDIYGLHCCWELEMNEDSRAPKDRSAKSGRAILSRYNAGF